MIVLKILLSLMLFFPISLLAQSYSVKSSEDLKREVMKTISKIELEKNKSTYLESVAIIAAHNIQLRGKNFWSVFNGKTPKDILRISKSVKMEVNRKCNSNLYDERKIGKAINDDANRIYDRLYIVINSAAKNEIFKDVYKALELREASLGNHKENVNFFIKNPTSFFITAIDVVVIYKDENRKNPWAIEVMKLEFPGALEPSESRFVKSKFSVIGEFSKVPEGVSGNFYFNLWKVYLQSKSGDDVCIMETSDFDPFDIFSDKDY